jgi:hypothetical protein
MSALLKSFDCCVLPRNEQIWLLAASAEGRRRADTQRHVGMTRDQQIAAAVELLEPSASERRKCRIEIEAVID